MSEVSSENIPQIDLNPQFEEALSILENTSAHLLVTGKAGTGKSTLLNHFRLTTKKNHAVVAPTGIAAVNVSGETIHSFFKFKPTTDLEEAKLIARRTRSKELYKALDCLIIDEISMVRADLLDCIDTFLREIRKSKEPFGGVQMVMFGDLFQLPPVVTQAEMESFSFLYESPYFFSSISYRQIAADITFIELERIYRQNEEDFIEILNAIRNGSVTPEQLSFINNSCYDKPLKTRNIVYLASTNYIADDLNRRYLAQIPALSKKMKGKVNGSFEGRNLPTEEDLELKVGARVMFLNNDSEKRWINGTLGTIKEFSDTIGTRTVVVTTDEGKEVEVEPFTWTAYKSVYDSNEGKIKREESGSFKQLPIKLAWAITIHKSQGKTFDNIMIDLGRGAFAFGQTYVALSRCRTLDGIILKKPLSPKDIILDERVIEFYRRMSR